MIPKYNLNKRWLKWGLVSLSVMSLSLTLLTVDSQNQEGLAQTSPPVQVAQIRVQEAWKRVYEQLPDFPKENQYISVETGKVADSDTLVSRLIRYHVYVKGRPPQYRFDWKLTLADYLGVNEVMQESQYPSRDTLKENPMEGDRTAIESLNRTQRDELVNTIVSFFNPNVRNLPSPDVRSSPPSDEQPQNNSSPLAPLPKPGDSQLLTP